MAYSKLNWQDRVIQYAKRYTLKNITDNSTLGTYDLTQVTGSVSQAGTNLNASALNHMDDGIANNDAEITKIKDGTTTVKKAEILVDNGTARNIYLGKTIKIMDATTDTTGSAKSSQLNGTTLVSEIQNITLNNNKVFHAGNDGHGSGLDADTLDGNEASYFAVKNHASTGTSYGVSTSANYGHTKVINNLTTNTTDGAVSLHVNQGKVLNESKAPNNHKSSSTAYGVGDGSNYGHLRLSDSISSTSSISGGYASTPKAVKNVQDNLNVAKKILVHSWTYNEDYYGTTFVVPKTAKYRVICIGKGGNGGSACNNDGVGSGGGGGAYCESVLTLTKGQSIKVGGGYASSFGSYMSAGHGGNGSMANSNQPIMAGGSGGVATGGNIYNINGSNGGATDNASGNEHGHGGNGGNAGHPTGFPQAKGGYGGDYYVVMKNQTTRRGEEVAGNGGYGVYAPSTEIGAGYSSTHDGNLIPNVGSGGTCSSLGGGGGGFGGGGGGNAGYYTGDNSHSGGYGGDGCVLVFFEEDV